MPELPEVETIRNELVPYIVGRIVTDIEINDPRLIVRPAPDVFKQKVVGRKITGIGRRGKYLIFRLSDDTIVIMHLRMTGSLLLNPENVDRYIRAKFRFDNGNELFFIDRRRLGVMWLVEGQQGDIPKTGLEPLSNEFNAGELQKMLRGRKAPIKAVLLDQTLVAGIGNMYADEALFMARIHPLRKAGALSRIEIEQLHNAIVTTLKAAIGNKGASIDTYSRPGGEPGTAHYQFKVAHRRGSTCYICGTGIQRTVVRNRGSYFCPGCQKL